VKQKLSGPLSALQGLEPQWWNMTAALLCNLVQAVPIDAQASASFLRKTSCRPSAPHLQALDLS
jgi:hypothetical protein